MACGYEDANDSNRLRKDSMFKLATGRSPLDNDSHPASAPTFTRLGKSMTRQDIYRIAEAFVHHFIRSYELPPMAVIIDLDHTPAITHGSQQLNLFNAKHQDYCYLPLMIFEGLSGKLMTAILRPGKTPTGKENAAILKRIIELIRKRWPKTHLPVRGDSHFAQPELMQVVQDENVIKHLKSDLSGDRLSDQGFPANHLRMFYACAAYVLHYELRTKALKGTELEKVTKLTLDSAVFHS